MRFGLFCSPKADAPGFRPETGRGFFDYLEFNVEAEALGFHSSFSVEHHFSGWNQVSSTLMLLSAWNSDAIAVACLTLLVCRWPIIAHLRSG